jgi:hypothetical protein
MADPHDYNPDTPLGDMEVGTMLREIGKELQQKGDREKARTHTEEVLRNHLVKDGEEL